MAKKPTAFNYGDYERLKNACIRIACLCEDTAGKYAACSEVRGNTLEKIHRAQDAEKASAAFSLIAGELRKITEVY